MKRGAIAWRIARREIDLRFRGLRLLLVCLALGVGALAAIGSLTQGVEREITRRGATILGGDLELTVSQRAATADERHAMAAAGRVSTSVKMQATAIGGTHGAPRVVPIALKSVDAAYPLVGTLSLRGGPTTPLAADTAWIAPALADRLQIREGGRFRIGTATFRVAGVIADEPDRLGEGFTLGPVAIVSSDGLARTGLVQPGSLYESRYRILLAGGAARDTADAFRRRFATAGWQAKTSDRAAPGAARFLDRMGQFLMLVALSALVIAGIGVGNGVRSYFAARRGGIATLKILGATSGDIARIYALQLGVIAAIGIGAGMIAGVAAVPVIVALAGDALPVAPQFAIEAWPLLYAALNGALIAVAFTAAPLLAAGHVPAAGLLRGVVDRRQPPRLRSMAWSAVPVAGVVALALIDTPQPLLAAGFLGSVAAVLAVFAGFGVLIRIAASRAPRPRRPLLRLAIAALHRPGAQTGALAVALGLGLTLFVLLAATRTAIDANIARTVPQRAPSLFALDVPPAREGEFRHIVAGVTPTATVRTVPAMRGTITGYGATRVADLKTLPDGAWALRGERGLTYAQTLPPGSTITAGAWWPRGYTGPPLVSVDERLAGALKLKIGDPLSFSLLGVERTARIASFRRIDWDTLGFNFVLVFSPNAIADAPHNLAATINLPKGREAPVLRALLAAFPSVSVIEVGGVLAQVRTLVSQLAAAITAAASVAVLAGIAVLIGAIAAAREARTYDSVILRTLGATRLQLLGAQAIEYVLLAGALGAVALALGLGGAWYIIVRVFDFAWLPDYRAVAVTLVMGTAMIVAIGLAGAWPILSVRPARALREL